MTAAERVDAQLRGIVHLVDSAGKPKTPPQQALLNIRELAVDALEILKTPDPLVQRLGTAVLVIKRCTEVRTRRNNEKYAIITNRTVMDWAICEIHEIYKD